MTRHDCMTMTIDAQAGASSVEIEPSESSPLATCLVRSLVASHFEGGAAHVVLIVDGSLWFTTTNVHPPP